MKSSLRNLLIAAGVCLIGAAAYAQNSGTQLLTQPTGAEMYAVDYPGAVSLEITGNTLAAFMGSQPGANSENALIGGDSDTNLYARGTTGASVTTAVTYGGPDRWAYWSGTNTAMTVSRSPTAGDLPAGKTFASAFKMQRTNGQTGVVQMCMMQEVESVNSYAFSGNTAEIDFHVSAGATYSGGALTTYLISGTGTDEGTVNAAFGLNAGGGGASGWTGQVNTGVNVTPTTTNNRFTIVAPVPTGATELAVALCYTPTGTAGANDYLAFSGIQLTRNNALKAQAGSAGAALLVNDTRAKSFQRRSQALETELQQRYYYRITDNVANTVPIALCQATTTSAVVCPIQFPVTMRAAPTAVASAATAFGDTATAGAPSACTGFAIVASSTSTQAGKVTCTAGATVTAGGSSQLVGANTSANVSFSSEL